MFHPSRSSSQIDNRKDRCNQNPWVVVPSRFWRLMWSHVYHMCIKSTVSREPHWFLLRGKLIAAVVLSFSLCVRIKDWKAEVLGSLLRRSFRDWVVLNYAKPFRMCTSVWRSNAFKHSVQRFGCGACWRISKVDWRWAGCAALQIQRPTSCIVWMLELFLTLQDLLAEYFIVPEI